MIFSQVVKKISNFSRIQILGAVTVLAGLVLAILIFSAHDEVPTQDNTTAPTNTPVQINEDLNRRENQIVITGDNRSPVITSIVLGPNIIFPGVPVRVEVKAIDPDQDDVKLIYRWKKNGEVVADQVGETFDTNNLRKGDLITVTVIPDDGKEQGKPLDSNGILIQNHPPEITSLPTAGISSGYFQYQVTAKDADNDPLQFSLEGAPSGMTIDPTGMIQWNVPRGLNGKEQIRVIVSDGSASSFQAFNLNLGNGIAQ